MDGVRSRGTSAPRTITEAAVTSLADAMAAESGGISRVEICGGSLDDGGVTPEMSLVAAAVAAVRIPVHVLIRPRHGDFVYGPAELARMSEEIVEVRARGAAAVAIGALTPDGDVDLAAVRRFIGDARPMRVGFHRAFDLACDQFEALEQLVALGVDYVLTSGAAPTAVEGIERLRDLVAASAGRITVVAAGSINATNVRKIVRQTRVTAAHGRAIQLPSRS